MDVRRRTALLVEAYRFFNDRDVGALLDNMTDDVQWPDVANAHVLHGKEAIRGYWLVQFSAADCP